MDENEKIYLIYAEPSDVTSAQELPDKLNKLVGEKKFSNFVASREVMEFGLS